MEEYLATSKDISFIESACNGHIFIYGRTLTCKITDQWAYFYDTGKLVWNCNERYARFNFTLEPSLDK